MGTLRRSKRGKTAGSVSASVLGIVVFLVGVGMLAFTFKLAYDMFMVPPPEALGIKPKQPLDLGQAGQSFVKELLKVLFLIVMGLMGSLIANRGVSLFAGSSIADKKIRTAQKEPSGETETERIAERQ
jgi:hypothetical protein